VVTAIDQESADVLADVQSPDDQPLQALPGQYVVLRVRQTAGAPCFFAAIRSQVHSQWRAIESA
jgi:NAD(P)H-flavin reductase